MTGSHWFRNGSIYTLDDARPWATSLVVHDGVIAHVGDDDRARAVLRDDTEEIDLAGGFLMPGFIDGHDHLIGGALSKVGVSLEGLEGKDAVLAAIQRYANEHPHHDIIRGHGWTPFTFGQGQQPHRSWLDSVTDVRPAMMHTYDVHDVWANTAAFFAAGIDADTPDPNPPLSYWPRDPDGFPSGTCCEPEAWIPIAIALGMFTVESVREAMSRTMAPAPSWGITSYFDATPIVNSMRLINDTYEHLREMNERYRSPNFAITTLKLFMDGVGPQHTAAMLEPYADQPHRGAFVMESHVVRRYVEAANLAGFDVHIHACGDAGVRGALDAIEAVQIAHPHLTPRNTVCHLEFCHPDDAARFAQLGVTMNGTPVWGTDYRGEFVDSYPTLVGAERFERDYCPYGDIVRSGALVTFGADCPGVEVHEIPPLVQIEAAVTRRRPGLPDDRPVGEHQRVTVAEALRCYTLNGAVALRLEQLTGSLEVGKQADLVVLGASPFDVPAHEIHSIPVRLTMLGGRITHDAR